MSIASQIVWFSIPLMLLSHVIPLVPFDIIMEQAAKVGKGKRKEEEEEEVINLKVYIDNVGEKVLFAESDKDFVDILLSFLTLPMGTIVKLLRNQEQKTVIGCFNSLYQSIENLDEGNFKVHGYKSHALNHQNPSQAQCRKLKLNLDDTEPRKYYLCETCYFRQSALLSYHCNKICRCGKLMTKEMYNVDDYEGHRTVVECKEGVFVKGTTNYIVTNDLQVMPSSTVTTLELLAKLGVEDASGLKEKTFALRKSEVLSLLRLSLFSKTPLTDLVFRNNVYSSILMFEPKVQVQSARETDTRKDLKKMTLKVICSKSKNKILYAEAQEDFIDYLLGLQAITLGSMVKLLEKTPSLGCICNLYKSAEGLCLGRFLKSEDTKAKLLSPKLGMHISNPNSNCTVYQMTDTNAEYKRTIDLDPRSCISKNAKSPTWKTIGDIELIKGPATYLVTDDLVVKPLSQDSGISILNYLEVPISDLGVQVVTFDENMARRLLEASLFSKSALTIAFNFGDSK